MTVLLALVLGAFFISFLGVGLMGAQILVSSDSDQDTFVGGLTIALLGIASLLVLTLTQLVSLTS